MIDQEEKRRREYHQFLEASRPLTDDLKAVGFRVDNICNLQSLYKDYTAAVSILAAHLARDYPDDILGGFKTEAQHVGH